MPAPQHPQRGRDPAPRKGRMPLWAKLLLVFTIADMVLGLLALIVLQRYL